MLKFPSNKACSNKSCFKFPNVQIFALALSRILEEIIACLKHFDAVPTTLGDIKTSGLKIIQWLLLSTTISFLSIASFKFFTTELLLPPLLFLLFCIIHGSHTILMESRSSTSVLIQIPRKRTISGIANGSSVTIVLLGKKLLSGFTTNFFSVPVFVTRLVTLKRVYNCFALLIEYNGNGRKVESCATLT